MQAYGENSLNEITLEAPGDFLSGLLGVSEVEILALRAGGVRELPEKHGTWRVLSPLEGRVRVTAGERCLPLEAGQAAAAEGTEELSLLAAEDCALCLISLCGSAADRVFAETRTQGGLFFERGGEAAARLLHVVTARHRVIPAREASELAYSLLMALYGSGTPGPDGKSTMPPVVEAALGLIRRDYAYLEGIAELASRLEVSQEYLTRCFCKYTGITPGKYLNQVRIENAKLLLRQGRHSVQFVSEACGFANANYFARVFRASVGVNPRDYARARETQPAADGGEDRLYVL